MHEKTICPNHTHSRGRARHDRRVYVFQRKHSKKSIPLELSPYIQIIQIMNKPIKPILLIHIYKPLHQEDLHLIKNQIKATMESHPTYTIFLNGHFNKNISIIGRIHNVITQVPTLEDTACHTFTTNIGLVPIINTTNFTRQGSQD